MMPARIAHSLAGVALLVLVSTACAGPAGLADTGARSATPTDRPEPAPSQAPSASDGGDRAADAGHVPKALRFSAPQLGGGTIEGADYAGRDVAFWFWAPW